MTIPSQITIQLYRLILRHLVDIVSEDHLSGLKGAAFWTHFSKPDCMKFPVIYMEKIQDRIAAAAKAVAKKIPEAETRTFRAMLTKRERDLNRMVKCVESTLADHARGKLLEAPDIGENNETKSKVFEYGDVSVGKSRTVKPADAKKPMNPRVCIDCFLVRAIEHWIGQEETEQEDVQTAYKSWDLNDDGQLTLEEFAHMIRCGNPTAGRQRIIRAFIAACGTSSGDEDSVLVDRLVPALHFYGLVLKERPEEWSNLPPGAAPAQASTEEADRIGLASPDVVPRAGSRPTTAQGDDASTQAAVTPLDATKKKTGLASIGSAMKSLRSLAAFTSMLNDMPDIETVTEEDLAVGLT